ncbi:MAG: thioredoxin domain-containing protein, partial [Sphingomonadaceae bacterium]|nr:thioredoxin domain-containing protein [Sphingomonadaceae bacterium]
VSYTCPHCAHFARDGDAALQFSYVGSGRVQLEVRHFVRDVVDLTAAMLTNCGAPAKFPRNHAAFMLGQEKWLPKAASATQAQQQRWFTGAPAARHRAIASDLGFYEIMSSRGYTRTQVDACLADSAMSQRLVDNTVKDAKALDIKGTPSFAINGVLLDGVHDWQSLQPRLDAKF